MMLHETFRCETYSKYLSPEQPQEPDRALPARTGASPLRGSWIEAYTSMLQDDNMHFVKTHDGPEDNGRTIYIVRNGLAAIRSYKHFLYDVHSRDYSPEQIILGETQFGSWGRHLDAWNPLQRPSTLLLKYEDLVNRPDEQLQRVAEFTGLTKRARWVNNFKELHRAHPEMYRQGHAVAPDAGFTESQQELFWAVHGDWMHRLGYGRQGRPTRRVLRSALTERLQALGAAAPNGHRRATEDRYRTLKKHWWTRLGRNIGLLAP